MIRSGRDNVTATLSMRGACTGLILGAAVAAPWWTVSDRATAATSEPGSNQQVDPAPCVAAALSGDADTILVVCTALVDDPQTARADRIKALIARAGAYGRKDQIDRAIGDYGAALRFEPGLTDVFNARGELFLRKGDRPRALQDFGAALKLNPQHEAARANYKSLALELERMGAQMAIKNKPAPSARSNPPLK